LLAGYEAVMEATVLAVAGEVSTLDTLEVADVE